MKNINILKKIAAQVRFDIIEMTSRANSGHPGGSLSATEALVALYFGGFLKYDAKEPKWSDRDRLVLSKGHCTPALYSVLSIAGYFSRDELKGFRKFGSMLQGHTHVNETPGVESCGGPLGQGLAVGLGMAIAAKIDKKDYKTYVIIGDGESEKGSVTESAKLASVYKMDNLICLLDYNKLDQDGRISNVIPANYEAEWKAYGWHVIKVNGNKFEELVPALEQANKAKDKPTIIILDTIKGKGISFMEKDTLNGISKWHGEPPKGEQLEHALKECRDKIAELEKIEKIEIFNYGRECSVSQKDKKILTKLTKPKITKINNAEKYKEAVETRAAFGKYIVELGRADERVVALTAGVEGSVKMGEFAKEFGSFNADNRNGRFIQIGIAEQNMVGVAAGLALCGKKPWAATFDIFYKEAISVIRNAVCYANVDVKLVATHAGLGVEYDGGSHQTIIMPMIMYCLPFMQCYEPCDGNEVFEAMKLMYEYNGPAYLRLTRQKLPVQKRNYSLEKNKGAYMLKESKNDKVVIMASGAAVDLALSAADELEKQKIPARVIDIVCLDKLDNNEFRKLIPDNAGIVTVHDASYKVLKDVVSGALTSPESKNTSRLIALGIQNFGESGTFPELIKKNGFDVASIVNAAKKLVN